MRLLLIALGTLVAVALIVTAVGAALPRAHVAARQARIPAPPADVWGALTDVAAYPRWRSDVRAVEPLPPRDGRPVWREDSKHGRITFETRLATPPSTLVTRIADDDLPFGGEWHYLLFPDGAGTRVVIVEKGEVRNPLFRFMSRFVFGHAATIDEYLRALGKRFGAEVTPEDADVVQTMTGTADARSAEVPHGA